MASFTEKCNTGPMHSNEVVQRLLVVGVRVPFGRGNGF